MRTNMQILYRTLMLVTLATIVECAPLAPDSSSGQQGVCLSIVGRTQCEICSELTPSFSFDQCCTDVVMFHTCNAILDAVERNSMEKLNVNLRQEPRDFLDERPLIVPSKRGASRLSGAYNRVWWKNRSKRPEERQPVFSNYNRVWWKQ